MPAKSRLRTAYGAMFHDLGERGVCTYCGEAATTRDHVLPISVASTLHDLGVVDRGLLVVVPACLECNALAGSRIFPSIGAKRRFLQKRLGERYSRLLSVPDSRIDSEVGPGLASYLGHMNSEARRARRRLAWRAPAAQVPQLPRCEYCGEQFRPRQDPRRFCGSFCQAKASRYWNRSGARK